MKGKMKKLVCCLFSFAMAVSCLNGCQTVDDDDSTQPQILAEDVEFWSCDASRKILQNFLNKDGEVELIPEGYYDDVKKPANLSIIMARGEYEAAQLIMTPDVDVPYYNATISDLTHTNGTAKIEAEDISVYHERYMPVEKDNANAGTVAGYYPDALVPMSAIVEYEHNKIKANENQGVYVSVESAIDQEVGTYTGTLTLDFKSFTKKVPVTVQVLDVTVNEETHAKSQFLNKWQYLQGELDTTQEKYQAYTDALIEYRLAPEQLYRETNWSKATLSQWVEDAYEELQNPRLSCLGIPSKDASTGSRMFDTALFEMVLQKIADKSFETDFDMFARLVFYNARLDEPVQGNIPVETIQENCRAFNGLVANLAAKIEADATITSPIKADVVESIKKLPHIITNWYYEGYYYDAVENPDGYVNTFCPRFNYLATESQRETYFNNEGCVELWWYGCNTPISPYVSYHLEYADTLGPRLLSWMQMEYNIVGNLYWATNDYGLHEDYFDWNAAFGGNGPHMEGILFYPGGQYGLMEPIPSMRLEAIRDGMEEYELLYNLKQKYVNAGLPADEFISSMTSTLYSNAALIGDVDAFNVARMELLNACIAADAPAELCLISLEDMGDGTVEAQVYAKTGYALTANGVAVTGGAAQGNGYIYTITTALDKAENALNITYVDNGTTYTYTKSLSGKATIIAADDFYTGFKKDTSSVEATLVDGTALGFSGNLAKLNIGASKKDEYQQILFEDSALFGKFNATTEKVVIALYNDSDEDITATLSVKYKKNALYQARPETVLKSKEITYIEIPLASLNWTKYGSVEKLRLWIEDAYNQPARELYVKSIIIYDK